MFELLEANPGNPIYAIAIVQLMNEYACHPMGGGQSLSDECIVLAEEVDLGNVSFIPRRHTLTS